MSRAFDFVVLGVIYIIAVVIHLMGVELFAPGTPLHGFASQAVNLGGAEKADLWYQIIALWAPLLSVGGITMWAFFREYRRQAVTAVRSVR